MISYSHSWIYWRNTFTLQLLVTNLDPPGLACGAQKDTKSSLVARCMDGRTEVCVVAYLD